ncbi:MAG: RNA recognition motif domain-containing protein [Bacteroidia bacterium]
MKLRISPISTDVTKAVLLEIFQEYGEVESIQILRSSSEAIALVEMFKTHEAEKAMDDLDESIIGDTMVNVEDWHTRMKSDGK